MFGNVPAFCAAMHVATDDEITSGTDHVKCQANIFQTFISSQLFGTKLGNLIKAIGECGNVQTSGLRVA